MPTKLTAFTPITGLDGFYTATRGGLRCNAIRLNTGDLCLYSPVAGLGDTAMASLDAIGKVAFLFAPNQYHNKALVEYARQFPDARLIAPQVCHARLKKITGLTFEDISGIEPALPDDIRLVTPEGLKTGEVWVIAPGAWLVVDAFAGAKGDGDRAQLLKTFPRYGVGDCGIYAAWMQDHLKVAPPGLLVPCHGGLVQAADLPDQLMQLINQIT